MSNWKSLLKADPTDWLLEKDNPSVRYLTLTQILGRSEEDPEVTDAKRQIMEIGIVPRILARQKEEGYWGIPEDFYVRSKYKGTVWQFIILAELGAEGREEAIRRASEFLLQISQDHQSGGFAYTGSRTGGGHHTKVVPCLTGNMVWSLIRFGYLDDPRVQQGIRWITTHQRFDDAVEEPPKGWPYEELEQCWGRHTCHMGAIKALKALAEIPPDRRPPVVQETLNRGAEYFLEHHIHKRSHDPTRVGESAWLRFGFPLLWKTNALEILGLLAELGYRDERMQEAIDLVLSKQDSSGRWLLEDTFNGRFLVNIEHKGKPSKWITLKALLALKRLRSGG